MRTRCKAINKQHKCSGPDELPDDPERIKRYLRGFFGYGSVNARVWLVGPEEAGKDRAIAELNKRSRLWAAAGEKPITCADEFLAGVPIKCNPFQSQLRQPTWTRLIKVLMHAEGAQGPFDTKAVMRFKQGPFCRAQSHHALLELSAVPRPRAAGSLDALLQVFGLTSEELKRERVRRMLDLITEAQPNVILFYGKTQFDMIEEIYRGLGRSKALFDSDRVHADTQGTPCLLTMRHPSNGCPAAVLEEAARFVRQAITPR